MKIVLSILGLTIASSASAQFLSKAFVVCGEGSYFYSELYPKFYLPFQHQSANEQAQEKLAKNLYPYNANQEGRGIEQKPVWVIKSDISKPSISSVLIETPEGKSSRCGKISTYGKGKCETFSICVTANVQYQECMPTRYNEETGVRYAICPNGTKFEY